MKSYVAIDSAGRIVVPKPVRDQLQLRSGDLLDVAIEGGGISLRPQRNSRRMHRKNGHWVMSAGGGQPMTAEEYQAVIDGVREERSRVARGEDD